MPLHVFNVLGKKSKKKVYDSPRLPEYPMAGLPKEDAERANRSRRVYMGADEGPSDFESSTDKEHQKERRRAAAWLWRQFRATGRVRLRNKGLTTKGKVREDLKLRELMQAKERAPPTPAPPSGTRKASTPDSVHFREEFPPLPILRGEASKTTKTRRQSSGPRKTRDHSLFTAGVSPLLANPILSAERHSRFYTHPSRGNRQDSLSEYSAPFF